MTIVSMEEKEAEVSEKKEAEAAEESSQKAMEDKMYPDGETPPEETPDDKSAEDKAAEDKVAEDKEAEDKEAEGKSEKDDKGKEATEGIVVFDDLKFPEGVPVDEGIQDEFLKVINDKDMTPKDRAQAMIELQSNLMVKAHEAHEAVIDGWAEEAGKDPEIIGADGTKKDENLALSNKGMAALKIDGLPALLIDSGYGNHPIMIKAFMKIGAMVSDDKFITTGHSGGTGEAKTVGERMYGADGEGKKQT
jgi:hypothetical protein